MQVGTEAGNTDNNLDVSSTPSRPEEVRPGPGEASIRKDETAKRGRRQRRPSTPSVPWTLSSSLLGRKASLYLLENTQPALPWKPAFLDAQFLLFPEENK